jgi:hypothetical protein
VTSLRLSASHGTVEAKNTYDPANLFRVNRNICRPRHNSG